MHFPNELSPEKFLAGFWQKQPLFMPGGLDAIRPALSSGDLAWLATQEDVESRLVITHGEDEDRRYEVRHGPFREDELSALPDRNWTLLVQDVEKHLPDFRALLDTVNFIADWRIDDLMVSCAAPGGSVGPHLDNYDVFLCQGEGRREWRLGENNRASVDPAAGELALLRPFEDLEPRIAVKGDVLYLPPGVPHWGIARDLCITYSIGMRAPSLAELNVTAARLFDESDDMMSNGSPTGTGVLYEDPDLTTDEASPGLISAAAVRRAEKLLRNNRSLDDSQIAMTLGATVTDPKAWLAPECFPAEEVQDILAALDENGMLEVHGMARIAYFLSGDSCLVFANGHSREIDTASLRLFRALCENRRVGVNMLCADGTPGLKEWLLASGVFDLTEADS